MLGPRLRALRTERGLSLRALGARVYCSHSQLAAVEKGTRTLSRALAKNLDAFFRTGHELELLASQSITLSNPENDDHVKRRVFLASTVAASALALLPRSIATLGHIGPDDIADGWRALHRLYYLDDVIGGASGYPLAADMARRLRAALYAGRFTSAVRGELESLTAAAMEHTGWSAFDSGDAAAARGWWLEANHLADVAGIAAPRIASLSAMALQTSREPATAAETPGITGVVRSLAGGTNASPILSSLLAARDAVAHAHRATHGAASAALCESRRQLDRGGDGTEPPTLDFWGEADLACQETTVALLAGDRRGAVTAARHAVESVDGDAFPRNEITYSVRLGYVYARIGFLDESIAVSSANLARGTDALRGSSRNMHDLEQTLDIFDGYNYRPAREFARVARQEIRA